MTLPRRYLAAPLGALIVLALPGCPSEECVPVGSARILAGYEPGFDGLLSNPQSGDAYLANDRVQVVVQGPGRNLALNPWGGNIIDADVLRGDGSFRDVFGEVGAFVNLAGTPAADRVTVGSDGLCNEPAQVVVESSYRLADYVNLTTGVELVLPGALDGVQLDEPHALEFLTTYTAVPGEPFVRVALTATNTGSSNVPWILAWLAEAGPTRAFVPNVEGWDLRSFGGAEYMVFAGDEVAYGLLPLTEERLEARGYVSLVGGYALAQDNTVLEIFDYPEGTATIGPGESRTADLAFVVGASHAEVVETITGLLGAPCTVVEGSVVEEGSGAALAGVFVSALGVEDGEDGDDLARATTGSGGAFSLCLPPGAARLIAGQEGRPYAGGGPEPLRVDVTVASSGPQSVGTLELPPTGSLTAALVDSSGAPLPSRLTVYGVDPSPHSYRLDGDRFDPRPPGVAAMLDSADGRFELSLEPGEYDAVFTRGPEYTLVRVPFTQGLEPVSLEGTLHRVVDTTGHLSGDFHVHAQASPDSQIADTERVINMVAEGVEILVSTDHAYVTDYAPVVAGLGLEAWITTLPGQEITTFDYGHFNAFPLTSDPTQHNRGAFDWTGLAPPSIFDELQDPEARVVQVNHPRAVPAPGEGNYFNNVDLQFDEDGPYVGSGARDPLSVRLEADAQMLGSSFVAVEVMTWLDVQGLSDWFNFLNAGVRFTATANSDTHTLAVESSGWPRNYVRMDLDDPAAMTAEDLVLAMHSGRNVMSFGPFVRLSAQGATDGEPGDTVAPNAEGNITVSIDVQAPPWIPFDDVTLLDGATNTMLAGGEVTPDLVAVGEAPEAQRLQVHIEHTYAPTEDTWLVVLVSGSEGLFPGIAYNSSDPATLDIAAIRAGDVAEPATAFAATNALFVDADGDGVQTPSHLVLPQDFQDWRWEDRTNPY